MKNLEKELIKKQEQIIEAQDKQINQLMELNTELLVLIEKIRTSKK